MFTSILQLPLRGRGEKVNGPIQAATVRRNETVNLSAFLLFSEQLYSKGERMENQESVTGILVYARVSVIGTFCHKSEDDSKKKLQKIEATVCRPSCARSTWPVVGRCPRHYRVALSSLELAPECLTISADVHVGSLSEAGGE